MGYPYSYPFKPSEAVYGDSKGCSERVMTAPSRPFRIAIELSIEILGGSGSRARKQRYIVTNDDKPLTHTHTRI